MHRRRLARVDFVNFYQQKITEKVRDVRQKSVSCYVFDGMWCLIYIHTSCFWCCRITIFRHCRYLLQVSFPHSCFLVHFDFIFKNKIIPQKISVLLEVSRFPLFLFSLTFHVSRILKLEKTLLSWWFSTLFFLVYCL